MRFLYNIALIKYGLLLRFVALWNEKAKLWSHGRRNLLKKIAADFAGNTLDVVWIHSASLGEFEQARPLIEALRSDYKTVKIVVTFYSPSGYEIRKNYPLADFVYYLPEDTTANARRFIEIVNPKIAVFIKYEYWFNYMNQLHNHQIPFVYVSSIFRPSQTFFQFYGGWFLKHLKMGTHFFVQNHESVALLAKHDIHQVTKTGDTRFDRVASIAEKVDGNAVVQEFKGDSVLLVAGSSWPEDEKLLFDLTMLNPQLKLVVAPHLIDEAHIQQIEKLFSPSVRYSQADITTVRSFKVLIIDNMGMLSAIYNYANMAFIGGGFGAGIHNTLEAATFGMPIFIGPNYHKFQEAKDLKELGVIRVVNQKAELEAEVKQLLYNPQKMNEISEKSKAYIQTNKGATQSIIDFMKPFL